MVKDGALFCPKGTDPRCVCIKHHDDFKIQRTMTVAIWFQKHFRGQSSACLVSKGEWRKNFSLSNSIFNFFFEGGAWVCLTNFSDEGGKNFQRMSSHTLLNKITDRSEGRLIFYTWQSRK